MPNKLIIANTDINQDDAGRFCLNDLHRAAGGEAKHQPAQFLRLDSTHGLAQELSDMGNPISVVKGGLSQGTYVCKELVYAYAMWISAKFHLQVIRAYDGLVAAPAALSTLDILQIAMESEKGRLLAIEQRDQAIATKAQIGSKREATAMATAASAKREAAKLKDQLGCNEKHATVKAVHGATGVAYAWLPLRKWCKAFGQPPKDVVDPLYGAVKAWPADAWAEVHSVDLAELFGEVTA